MTKTVVINNMKIIKTYHIKCLGLKVIDDKLSFVCHINSIVENENYQDVCVKKSKFAENTQES